MPLSILFCHAGSDGLNIRTLVVKSKNIGWDMFEEVHILPLGMLDEE